MESPAKHSWISQHMIDVGDHKEALMLFCQDTVNLL